MTSRFYKCYITISGGLGNQMLSYSLWYYLRQKKRKVFLSPIHDGLQDHNGLEINKIFKKTQKIESEKTYVKKLRYVYSCINRYVAFAFKILGVKSSFDIALKNDLIPIIVFPRYEDYTFLSEIIIELRRVFDFPIDSDKRNMNLIEEMKTSQSVSIHIRRGDYQSKIHWRLLLGDICEKDYYNDAIDYIKKIFCNPKFYVFSDDIEWVKQNLNISNATFVNWNNGNKSFRDMQLMTYCKANIIANSTFSLMATWLNVHEDCIRIVSSKWTNTRHDYSYKKYIPQNWITINNSRPFVSLIIDAKVVKPEKIIASMYNQSISDWEIILPSKYADLIESDDFIKTETSPIGHHIIEIKNDDMWNGKDRYWLQKLVVDSLSKVL